MKLASRIWLALGINALATVVLFVPLAMAALAFLKDRMHLYCEFARMGLDDPGEYYCADGIGYIVPGVLLAFVIGLLLLATSLTVAIGLPRPRVAVRVLAGIGIVGLAFPLATAAVTVSLRHPASNIPTDTWTTVLLAPTVLLSLAALALVAILVVRSSTGIRIALAVALALTVAATAVEPTIAFGTVPALAACGLALWLAFRRTVPRPKLASGEAVGITSAASR